MTNRRQFYPQGVHWTIVRAHAAGSVVAAARDSERVRQSSSVIAIILPDLKRWWRRQRLRSCRRLRQGYSVALFLGNTPTIPSISSAH